MYKGGPDRGRGKRCSSGAVSHSRTTPLRLSGGKRQARPSLLRAPAHGHYLWCDSGQGSTRVWVFLEALRAAPQHTADGCLMLAACCASQSRSRGARRTSSRASPRACLNLAVVAARPHGLFLIRSIRLQRGKIKIAGRQKSAHRTFWAARYQYPSVSEIDIMGA